jgi:hypothetical protein
MISRKLVTRKTAAGAVSAIATLGSSTLMALQPIGQCLPPPEDPPEEVLRTEIILEARSPIDGELLTAAEYAELQAQLQQDPNDPNIDPEVREIIILLRLRRAIRTFFPFLLD